jgi:hypothetical protein
VVGVGLPVGIFGGRGGPDGVVVVPDGPGVEDPPPVEGDGADPPVDEGPPVDEDPTGDVGDVVELVTGVVDVPPAPD